MSRIKGACVFRDDGDGCLSSKYVNDQSEPFVEACKLNLPHSKPNRALFEGVYDTIWLEDKSTMVQARLTINLKSQGVYGLEWTESDKVIFGGVGMLYDGLLICSYWST